MDSTAEMDSSLRIGVFKLDYFGVEFGPSRHWETDSDRLRDDGDLTLLKVKTGGSSMSPPVAAPQII